MDTNETKQQTFGKVKVFECVDNGEECSQNTETSTCENNAVVQLVKNNQVEYFCELHSQNWMLQRVDYYE